MINITVFLILSVIVFIVVFIILKNLKDTHKNRVSSTISVSLIAFFYGAIFNGAPLIEILHLIKSDKLEAIAFLIAIAYILLIVKYPNKVS